MIRRLFLSLRQSKLGRMSHVVYLSFFAQPLDFIEQPRPVQAKLRNIPGLPLLPASLWAAANVSLIQWVSSRQLMTAGSVDPELAQQWHTISSMTGKGAFVLMLGLIYAVIAVRWGKHHGVAWIMSRLKRPIRTLPWSYFVISTTAAAIGFSLLANAIAWCVWRSDGHVRSFLNQLSSNSPSVMIWLVLVVGLAHHIHSRRSQRGMKAFYGKNYVLVLVLDLTLAVAAFFAVTGTMTWLSSHRT